jgi:small subunit ribosomal protein S8
MHYNILSELKNASRAGKDRTTFPYSKMDFAILEKLVASHYVKSVEKEAVGRKNIIVVRLAYAGKEKEPAINDFTIVSKPSRHFYMDYRSLKLVKQGHGVGMLSTSKGIMTSKEARKQKIGGEYLFEIW